MTALFKPAYSLKEYMDKYESVKGEHKFNYLCIVVSVMMILCFGMINFLDGIIAINALSEFNGIDSNSNTALCYFELEWFQLFKGCCAFAIVAVFITYMDLAQEPSFGVLGKNEYSNNRLLRDVEYINANTDKAVKECFEKIGEARLNQLLTSNDIDTLNEIISGMRKIKYDDYYIFDLLFNELPKSESVADLKSMLKIGDADVEEVTKDTEEVGEDDITVPVRKFDTEPAPKKN